MRSSAAAWPVALRALAAQTAAAVTTALAAQLFTAPGLVWLGFHSLTAVGFALLLRLPWWWLPMQFLFAPALLGVASLDLSPDWFLAAFVALALVYWSTWRTRVPLYLSGEPVWRALESCLPTTGRVLDLGSGLGGPLLWLARRHPSLQFRGIEAAPLPWLVSRLRNRQRNLHFSRGSFWGVDLAGYDLVFAYLSPAAMPRLWQKVKAEMRPGTVFVSVEFPVPGVAADQILETGGRQRLYVWRV